MKLIEREIFINALNTQFENLTGGEGRCILINGEAGMGKTSLIKAFCKNITLNTIYRGTCDALFTPRALAPLYDIALQMQNEVMVDNWDSTDRTTLFTMMFKELTNPKHPVILVFEDIHWADEATLDFIKFLGRRIDQIPCLFIMTYRDDEINIRHPLRNVLGQLPSDNLTRLTLTPLSLAAVEIMATEKGYDGKEVYEISGGNPFYVNEILASYSPGVPDNVRDAILSVYNMQLEGTRQVWDILSTQPTGFEVKYLKKMAPYYENAVRDALESKILTLKEGRIFYKHELYRRTIEEALAPFDKIEINKKLLEACLEYFEKNREIERIIHHAKNAHADELVARYAPAAAKKAALTGAHFEAAKLYLLAIDYTEDIYPFLYEQYAYECYLTNQHQEAIKAIEQALLLWKEQNNNEKTADCLRHLSKLWWFDGNRTLAEQLAIVAVNLLKNEPPSSIKAMAYSNIAQLKMLADQHEECLEWGENASAIAIEVEDYETLAHAKNSMGSALMTIPAFNLKGKALLQQSLEIALEHGYHEHVARAYTALGSNSITIKDYSFAAEILDKGINYCEEHDLDSLKLYMLSWKARLSLETGNWDYAYKLADLLLESENLLAVVKIGALLVSGIIKMRRNEPGAINLLVEAKDLAFATQELQRIIPTAAALLEYEWITGRSYIDQSALNLVMKIIAPVNKVTPKSRFYYWLHKTRRNSFLDTKSQLCIKQDILFWKQLECPYEFALALFEGNDDEKRKAISLLQDLRASVVAEKLKKQMRSAGIKSIPRGQRLITRSNPANLTERELDVLNLLKNGLQNKEIANKLFISSKTVDHHISAILTKLEVNSRGKAVQEAFNRDILK